jgi:nitrite reductase (cytochrome c-552)
MKNSFTLKIRFLHLALFITTLIATVAVLYLLLDIRQKKAEALRFPALVTTIGENELDPAVWGRDFPAEYESFQKTKINYGRTPYGGSEPYSKLERYPAMKTLWAGYSFSIDHNEERGHYYAAIDQKNTKRTKVVKQPGACVNCHAAEAPGLIKSLGWETFNRTPFDSLAPHMHLGSSCADCHDPATMSLRVTRPAFINAMEDLGVDLSRASRQEMRTYVCAQCHVEYYFKGKNKVLTFPWSKGRTIDDIEEYYDSYNFSDWTHKITGAPMIKIQHPEFELWTTSIHARSGVSCADCHMPYVRQGSVKVSDHWLRSPLEDLDHSCRTCHPWPEEELRGRVIDIQNKTASLLRQSEEALLDAIEAIRLAREKGVKKEDLAEACRLQRRSQMRWDFISSENSTGFHSPQEAARVLASAIDFARRAELSALRAGQKRP